LIVRIVTNKEHPHEWVAVAARVERPNPPVCGKRAPPIRYTVVRDAKRRTGALHHDCRSLLRRLARRQRQAESAYTTVAIRSPESNWRDQAARSLFPPIERTSLQLPTKTGHFKAVFQCFSRVRSTESSEFMERAMGIEPTSEAWEVLNFPIPFSSQRDARPLVSVNRWASKAHPVRPTPFTSVGRVGQLATASRKLRRQPSRVLALYDR